MDTALLSFSPLLDVDAEFLSRIQFALTISFHFIYPPLSMGLGLLMIAMGLMYLRTKDEIWRQSSFFWVRVYGLIFALGIATGIVQEFEFGMNWSQYSRFVGNVFGSLLAAEGVFAFALEGGFLGLLLFGGDRLGPRMWLLATILVVFGAHFSALWILMANSWMQSPEGYEVRSTEWGNLAFMTDFLSVVFTPTFLPRLFHTWVASWMVGASLVLSVSAWYLLKGRHVEFAKKNLTMGLWFFAVFAILQFMLVGPRMAISVTDNQQPKLAAMEGVFESQSCAPLFVVGWVNESDQTTNGISVPCLLSLLAYQEKDATVTGLEAFPEDDWAPVNVVFQVYHVMFNLGAIFALLAVVGLGAWFWKRKVYQWPWLLWVFVGSIVLTEVATLAGWWTAEIGRQPWIVWNVLRTSDAVSPTLSTAEVATSLTMFALLYALLFSLFIFLLNRVIQEGPRSLAEEGVPASLPDTFREVFRRARASSGGE